MDTHDILKQLRDEPNFIGVFARDRLPKTIVRPAGLVVNLDKAKGPGTHWVAIYFPVSAVCEYFDSLGQTIPRNEILRFIDRNSVSKVYNSIPYQSNTSTRCGQFCVHYLKLRLNGFSLCEIHATLSQNSSVNDAVV